MGLESPKKSIQKESVVFDPNKKVYKVAVISDLHFGSKWANTKFLETFIEDCKEQQINTLLNIGDTTDGLFMYDGHEKEVLLHSEYSYEEYAEEHYPMGFSKSFYIQGNHDLSIDKLCGKGYSFCTELAKKRKDLIYLPVEDKMCASITLKGGLKVGMFHGHKSCSDVSGRNRDIKLRSKILGFMANGFDDDIYFAGHCHKTHIVNFMGKYIIGVGCFQNTTPYLESRGSANDVCGLILSYQKRDDGFVISPQFKWEKDYIN